MSSNNLAKSVYEKDQNDINMCKKHASRCDKDYYRSVCPSKLSKRELEDLYYSLLENNLELKRTINAQSEKNRILSTKVQRMTAQTKTYIGKDCCAAAKAVINEQKAGIADLTKANEALAERIRKLSVQLCSAKQFLNQNPSMRGCYKCYTNASTSVKIMSSTSLQNKSFGTNLKPVASAIHIQQVPTSTRSADMNTLEHDMDNVEKKDKDSESVCSENKCKSIVEQFKQKIEDLEEELSKAHAEYSSRITQLENQVSALQSAAVRARSEQELRARDSLQLARGLRTADARQADLETQLSIEKSKVAELEMRIKAAKISHQVAQTVEKHLGNIYQPSAPSSSKTAKDLTVPDDKLSKSDDSGYADHRPEGDTVEKLVPSTSTKANYLTVPEDRLSKSDDSGYADHRLESDIADKNDKTNQELLKRINEMQAQLDALKSVQAEKNVANQESPVYSKTFDQYYKSGDEQDSQNQNVLPKRPRISISVPPVIEPNKPIIKLEHGNKDMIDSEIKQNKMPSIEKLDARNDTNKIVKAYESSFKNIYENDESDKSTPPNEILLDNNAPQQAVEMNCSIKCECPEDDLETKDTTEKNDEHSDKNISRIVNKDQLLNSPKETQHGDNHSNNEVEVVQPRPVNYYSTERFNSKPPQEDVQQDSSIRHPSIVRTPIPIRKADDNSQQIPLPITGDTIQKDSNISPPSKCRGIKPLTGKADDNFQQIPGPIPVSGDSIHQDLSTRHPSIVRTAKTAKSDDNSQQIPGPIPSKTPTKRKFSLIKSKPKSAGAKKKNEAIKDNGKNKVVPNKDIKNLKGKHDQKDVNEVHKTVHPSGTSRCKGTEDVLKCDYCENTNLPLDDSAKINGMRNCNEYGSVLRGPIGSSTPNAERPISPNTYTVESDNSRANSPANTEQEISVMTDLPSEKDDFYDRDRLSPGEHRTTGTSRTTSHNGYTLSEGEVPIHVERRISKSLGEVRRDDYAKDDISFGEQRSPREKMEATLQVISQELARCRSLLQARPQEKKKNVATTVDPVSLVLRKTEAKSHFEGTVTPTCLLTMHFMTVVLTDEAIMRSRDANLVLKWRFEHKTTMTPLAKGRVTHFDFSTQYELQITKEVEEFLRNEDILIMVCEMDSAKKPFATCALPLRQVLLNSNKRVDMSLPLRPGPHLREVSSTVQASNIGVLDIWCMLYCNYTSSSCQ